MTNWLTFFGIKKSSWHSSAFGSDTMYLTLFDRLKILIGMRVKIGAVVVNPNKDDV